MRREHPSQQGYEPFSFQDTESVSPRTTKSPFDGEAGVPCGHDLPSNITTWDARRETRTFLPIRCDGTEYFAIDTVIIADLSALRQYRQYFTEVRREAGQDCCSLPSFLCRHLIEEGGKACFVH